MENEMKNDKSCMPKVLAKILGIDVEGIPEFMEIFSSSTRCHMVMNDWLAVEHGIYLIYFNFKTNSEFFDKWVHGIWIGGVEHKSGIRHVVIMEDGEMIYDPSGRDFSEYELDAGYVICQVTKIKKVDNDK